MLARRASYAGLSALRLYACRLPNIWAEERRRDPFAEVEGGGLLVLEEVGDAIVWFFVWLLIDGRWRDGEMVR